MSALLAGTVRAEDITIARDTTWSAGTHTYGSVLVSNGTVLTFDGEVILNAASLTVEAGAAISADGTGYPAQQGPGAPATRRGGAGYGGAGLYGGATYGSAMAPTDMGSGSWLRSGGGAIQLVVSDTLTLDGTISATGGAGSSTTGGASGGSIYILANAFRGSGTMTANGGQTGYVGSGIYNGGGGGGRIAVHYQTSTFAGTAEASGGRRSSWAAEDGTVAFVDESNDILYVGSTFRFESIDSPFDFTQVVFDSSATTVHGELTIAQVLVQRGSSLLFADARMSFGDLSVDSSSISLEGQTELAVSGAVILDNTSTVSCSGAQTLDLASLAIDGKSTLTLSGAEQLIVHEAILTDSSTITHLPGGKIAFTAHDLTIEAGASIDASEKGYPIQEGPGTPLDKFGGASYGGRGFGGVPTYGSAVAPVDKGSGSWHKAGGGAVLLTVDGTLILDGSIAANGGDGSRTTGGAGSSGGSIYITANTLQGSGALAASGGTRGYDAPPAGLYYGAGGGGRIAVHYQTSTFAGTAEARGGSDWTSHAGEPGTVAFIDEPNQILYAGHAFRFQENDGPFDFARIVFDGSAVELEDADLTVDELVLDQGASVTLKGQTTLAVSGPLSLSASSTLRFEGAQTASTPSLVIDGGSTLILSGTETLTTDEITLTDSSVVTHLPGGKLELEVPQLSIDAGSSVSANGMGYPKGQGPGVPQNPQAGGSYGGKGGKSAGDLTYGSALTPTDLGSGSQQRAGGGAIRLIVSGTLVLEGSITADGENGNTMANAGGSGGSIYITVDELTGSGMLSASGGGGGTNDQLGDYASGGAGRIAVYYQSSSFTGAAEAREGPIAGGGPYTGLYGEEGTVVFVDAQNDILYTGHHFRFEENDSPFAFDGMVLSGSEVLLRDAELNVGELMVAGTSTVLLDGDTRIAASRSVHLSDTAAMTFAGTQILVTPSLTTGGASSITLSGEETLDADDIALTESSNLTCASESRIALHAENLTVESGASITADARGYPAGQGPGAPLDATGGGSHGGRGGGNSGPIYGSAYVPTRWGSGSSSKAGGGFVQLFVNGTLTVDGVISANGDNGNTMGHAGGSGGSLFIITSGLSGSGLLRANGGSGGIGTLGNRGSGGGGRIAVYFQSSAFSGTAEVQGGDVGGGGSKDGLYGEEGTAELIELGTLSSGSGYDPDFPFTFFNLTEQVSSTSHSSESILKQPVLLSPATVTGDLEGTLTFSDFEIVRLASGPFSDKGIFNSRWEANLEGVVYRGIYRGVVFPDPRERKINLKGTIEGDLRGVSEGFLFETSPESGIYDGYQIPCELVYEEGTEITSISIAMEGSLSYSSSEPYNAEIELYQGHFQGSCAGYYNGPMNAVITRVYSPEENDFTGFCLTSYSMGNDSGNGWFYESNSSDFTGIFGMPLNGLVSASLVEDEVPRALLGTVERLDWGVSPMPDLEVRTWGPGRVSPGQSITYLIEARNDGVVTASDIEVIDELPYEVGYQLFTNGDLTYSNEAHNVIWKLATLAAKSSAILGIRGTTLWGIPAHVKFSNIVKIQAEENINVIADPAISVMSSILDSTETRLKSVVRASDGIDTSKIDLEASFVKIPGAVASDITYTVNDSATTVIVQCSIPIGSSLEVNAKIVGQGSPAEVERKFKKTFEKAKKTIENTKDYYRRDAKIEKAKDFLSEEQYKRYKDLNRATWMVKEAMSLGGADKYVTPGIDPGNVLTAGVDIILDRRLREASVWKEMEDALNEKRGKSKSEIITAKDPNMMVGPAGNVVPGETLGYQIEFGNEGEGTAFGVYFTDVLDGDLDESTLEVGPVISTADGSEIAPVGTYDPDTRTITWLVGEVGPNEGGYADISVDVRVDAPYDTRIINFSTIYFPSVPEEIPTNGIVNIVRWKVDAAYDFPQLGWHFVSLPVQPENDSTQVLFPTSLEAFEWNASLQQYLQAQRLAPGQSYWLALPEAAQKTVTGYPVKGHSRHLSTGWHSIGSVEEPQGVEGLVDDPDGSIFVVYGWDPASQTYYEATTLEPGKGYWAGVLQACDLTIGDAEPSPKIVQREREPLALAAFYEKYGSMPPPPPSALDGPRQASVLPYTYELHQSYPNPFNPETVIRFSLAEPGPAQLRIYNISGQLVRSLIDESLPAGYHRIQWDGNTDDGTPAASGVYLYRITSGDFVQTKKMLLVK